MSELSPGWTMAPLSELADIIAGQAPPGASYNETREGFPLYQGKTDFGDLYVGPPRFWTTRAAKMAQPDDVLLSVRAPVGPTNLAREDCAIGRGLAAIRGRPGITQRYLLYALRATVLQLENQATGTTFAAITSPVIRGHAIPVAPTAEQERIVAAIEEEFSRLDAGVVALQRARQNLKRMRAASFNEAATHSPIAGILENTDGTWPVQPLGELADGPSGIVDGPFGSNLKSVHYTESGPRVLRLQNIGDGEYVEAEAHISRSHFEALRRHDVRPGDLVCAILGDVLPRAIVVPPDLGPAIVKADCPRIRLAEHMNPRFVWAVLNAPSTRQTVSVLIRGVGRPRLTVRALRQIPIPVPPRNVQDAVVQQLDSLLDASAALDRAVSQADTRQAAARSSILAAAFSGQLVPQDPIDEPASVLLARIAGERAASNGHNAARTRESRQKVSA